MNPMEAITQAREAITVRRVFGEPYEKNGVTIIPAAAVRGGGGGGEGEAPEGQGKGSGRGGGFGLTARPVGAFVIRDGDTRWEPAFDLTRIALMGQAVAIVFLFTFRSIVKARAKARVRSAKLAS